MSYAQLSGFIFLPQDILDWMNRLNGSIAQLDTDIMSSTVSDKFKAAWSAYKVRWDIFNKAHQGWWSRISGSTADEVAAYENEYNAWFDSYGKEPGAVSPLAKPSGTEHGGLTTIAPETTDLMMAATKLILAGGAVYLGVKLLPLMLEKRATRNRRRRR